jgi:hypothetical protein
MRLKGDIRNPTEHAAYLSRFPTLWNLTFVILESKARKVTVLEKYTVAIRNGATSSANLSLHFAKQGSYGVRKILRRFSSSYALSP